MGLNIPYHNLTKPFFIVDLLRIPFNTNCYFAPTAIHFLLP